MIYKIYKFRSNYAIIIHYGALKIGKRLFIVMGVSRLKHLNTNLLFYMHLLRYMKDLKFTNVEVQHYSIMPHLGGIKWLATDKSDVALRQPTFYSYHSFSIIALTLIYT